MIGRKLYDRFNPESYEFKPYNAKRLYKILSSRIKDTYGKKIAEDEALWKFTHFCCKNHNGNVRRLVSIFLDTLYRLKNGVEKVNDEVVRKLC